MAKVGYDGLKRYDKELKTTIVADYYSTSATYAVGDYCFYSGSATQPTTKGGKLNRCIVAITTAEEWTAAHWTEVQLSEDVAVQSRRIDAVEDEVDFLTNESKTVTAQPIQIDDGVEGMPVKNLSIAFSPKQAGSGDPSPENIRSITGYDSIKLIRSAKNICGGDRLLESFIDNGCAANRVGTDTDGRYYTLYAGSAATGKSYISSYTFKPNTQYTFIYSIKKPGSNNVRPNLAFYYTDGTYAAFPVNGTTGKVVRAEVSTEGKTVSSIGGYYAVTDETKLYLDESGLFEGNLATSDFVPYEGETITFPFETTRYGGTIDVLRGKAIITTQHYTFDGTEAWSVISGSSTNGRFRLTNRPSIVDTNVGAKCSHYPMTEVTSQTTVVGCMVYNGGTTPETMGYIMFRPDLSQYSTETAWKAFLADQYANGTPVQVCYTRKYPIEIDLTPEELSLFSGYNYIYSTGGSRTSIADKNITMEYGEAIASLDEKIERVIGEKTSAITSDDESSEVKYPSTKGMVDWVSSHTTHRQDTYYSGTSTFGSHDFAFEADGTYFLTATYYNVTSNNIAYGFLSVDVGRFINLTWLISPQSDINITVTPDTTNYDKITVTSTNKYLAVGIFKM